jgi:hypothetical protein
MILFKYNSDFFYFFKLYQQTKKIAEICNFEVKICKKSSIIGCYYYIHVFNTEKYHYSEKFCFDI